jgi:hypothetical protein
MKMNDEKSLFINWEEMKNRLEKIPENEQDIVSAMRINDGILKGFIMYLAIMW